MGVFDKYKKRRVRVNHPLALTTEEFIKRATAGHDIKYDYSLVNYVNGAARVRIICPDHGEFIQLPLDHLNGSNCPACAKISRHTKKSKTLNDFVKQSADIHANKYDYSLSEYLSVIKKVKIICPTHGEFLQIPNDHLNGHGCPGCAIESRSDQ